MKVLKTLLLVTTVFFFASTTFSLAATDCSKYKSFVQKKLCEGVQGVTSGVTSGSDKSKKKILKQTLIHLMKRIKH